MNAELSFHTTKADIEKNVMKKLGGYSNMEYPLNGVYVLGCDTSPGYEPERFFRATMQRDVPKWVSTTSDKGVYVGTSDDIVSRIHEHVIGEGAIFTRVFPPKRLLDVRKRSELDLPDGKRMPMHRKEAEIAEEYRQQNVVVSTG